MWLTNFFLCNIEHVSQLNSAVKKTLSCNLVSDVCTSYEYLRDFVPRNTAVMHMSAGLHAFL